MDPMEGLGGSPSGPSDSTAGTGREIFNSSVASKNALHMSDSRVFMSIVSGSLSGIVGSTGLSGMFLFFLMHALTGLGLLALLGGDVKSYTGAATRWGFLMQDVQKCGMTFMLFWTLFYGVVYLF
ncbi:hypothetical protein TrRE_jg3278 [Triparma retinervis]|uniref:ER membrane protein complex subunit 6 n=1 Tax=Triparma retinervis TaxID=2557542 RepID=A0A9W6ZYX4_9STRA|nr:hypothetical protein TrRE_jg3278 [Triparma retinervis]